VAYELLEQSSSSFCSGVVVENRVDVTIAQTVPRFLRPTVWTAVHRLGQTD
jgi:hypothetical protein